MQAAPGAGFAVGNRPTVQAQRTNDPPAIDGRLDDIVWRDATLITDFIQTNPVEGAAPTERTEVRIAYDADHLYFAFYAHYADPTQMRANRVDRDQARRDDWVAVMFDTFLDQQRAYRFSVNPYGVQGDAILQAGRRRRGPPGGGGDSSWDALFETEPDLGFNMKYGVTSNLTADFTLNPDFSQIETDRPQIETNQRYPLFFPELRPFFLDGQEIFDTPGFTNLVHTKTIVDPQIGGKLTGKAGNTTLGVLVANDEAPGKFDDPDAHGFGQTAQFSLTLLPTSRLSTRLSLDTARFTRQTGELEFDVKILRTFTTYQFTDRLLARSILEHNTGNGKVGINLLFTYRVNAGTVFYIGYDDRLQEGIFLDKERFYNHDLQRQRRAFFTKLQYLFRY